MGPSDVPGYIELVVDRVLVHHYNIGVHKFVVIFHEDVAGEMSVGISS
ncbi:hypothetical protein BWQ96_10616 [Gracilariopsis chorda]|uniref:Uncharacterized protein n=1 Tax=Gracilariopsis chorda TaxID=448386 RepID=A0A2V3IC47_9FLOR|nr:hypothetical protein BWQ96_10616 [Gracilariopsis chorda]|eukprot:PXF39682.1 hypothetical protein BWQ96_10616 [Gracilariopsis chorda]